MADLQELFSRLKAPSQPPQDSPPVHASPQDAKAASLLNLLRSTSQTQSSPLSALQNVHHDSPRSISGISATTALPTATKIDAGSSTSSPIPNPQAFLLNLLKQPSKPASGSAPLQAPQPQSAAQQQELVNSLAQVSAELDSSQVAQHQKEETPVRQFGSAKSRETTPFEVNTPVKAGGIFTYVNPFEQLSASTPQNRTPAPQPNSVPAVTTGDVDAVTKPKSEVVSPPQQSGAAQAVEREAAAPSEKKVKKEDAAPSVPETWQAEEVSSASTDVKVYNFPMRPFVSIQINTGFLPASLRTDSIMDISRLKKEFDQIDRCLATASQSHIVYAMSKSGGFRVIRQDSGRDKQVFKAHAERIFHVQAKQSTDRTPYDSILAAGVNGSVFWTRVDLAEDDTFIDEDLEAKGFILPPLSSTEDNTSGSLVKTRSRMTCRHSGIFAISRGKFIHVISPEVVLAAKYTDAKSRSVDTTKFFQDHSHKITTGKACKDFAFSEDDTTIVSLDKAGRIRFWDVRELSEAARSSKKSNMELKTPVLTYTASMASEKISPTSVMFLDKERPCNKGVALRYLLVGFKQNHVLQLWDLGLGKPVQELHFPHEKDSDAICSISYHPKTGIIALSHPTRNSIYFIHLSAPRYHIPNMEQAKYISMIAEEDTSLPKPESTAIMSGIRELSFGTKGQLRSVDMLATPASANSDDSSSGEILFELYAMHSTGATCLSIKKADLGWDTENKVMHPHDAEKTGFITLGPIVVTPASSASNDATPKPNAVAPAKAEAKQAAPVEPSSTVNVTASHSKESIKQSIEASPAPTQTKPRERAPNSYAAAARSASSTLPESVAPAAEKPVNLPETSTGLAHRGREKLTNGYGGASNGTAANFSNIVSAGFDSLTRRIEVDRKVQEDAANQRQDAVLKLVASTLTDNVEASLGKIVSSSLQKEVLPAVSDVFSALAERHLLLHLKDTISRIVPQEVRTTVPGAVEAAFKDPETSKVLTNSIASQLSQQVVQVMDAAVRKTIAPTIAQTIATSVSKAVAESEERYAKQRAEDANKIDRLANLVFGLSETLQRISTGQQALEQKVSSMQQQSHSEVSGQTSAPASVVVAPARSAEDIEVDDITGLMTEGKFEDGTIRWLQSSRQAELFDRLFVRVNPQYLQKLSPLVKLSVSAAVSTSFEQNVDQRLDWLGTILSTTDLQDGEIAQVAPKIMNVLLSRIQGAYMSFAETNPADPVLRKFSNLSRQITDIRKLLG